MSDPGKKQRPSDPPKRGEAAWRAQRDAIASRNEQVSRLGRAQRQKEYQELVAQERAAELRERADLSKFHH